MAIHRQKITKLHTQPTLEKRKLMYQVNVENLMNLEKGKLAEDEKKIAIEKVEDIIDEMEDDYTEHTRNNEYEQYSQSTCKF